MARIGFLILPGYGHILPSLGLAQALRARGHDIRYYSIEHFREMLEGEGHTYVPVPLPPRPPKPSWLSRYRGVIQNFRRMVDVTLDWLTERVRQDAVELLVVDQSVLSGRTVAELAGIPFVTLCAALHLRRDRRGHLPPFFAAWPPASDALARMKNRLAFGVLDAAAMPLLGHLNRRRRAAGLPPHRRLDDSFSSQACLSQLPDALEPAGIEDLHPFHLVGPLGDFVSREAKERAQASTFPFDRLAGGPVLYISFGLDGRVTEDVYRSVLEGSRGLGFLRVVSAGLGPVPDALQRLEDEDTLVVANAPQVAILRRAALVVTHGGINSALESLVFGRPMLVMPFCCDQPAVAARIRWAGAGLVVPTRKATATRVRTALLSLRDEPAWRDRAEGLASSLAKSGGAERAADVVERVLSTSRPADGPRPVRPGPQARHR